MYEKSQNRILLRRREHKSWRNTHLSASVRITITSMNIQQISKS